MKRLRSLLILGLALLLFLFLWNLKPDCVIKDVFGIPCPGCGMSRAFECIFSFNVIGSFSYNILAFPLFLFSVFFVFILIYDCIMNKDLFFKWLFGFLDKYYLVFIILLIVSECVNLYKGI